MSLQFKRDTLAEALSYVVRGVGNHSTLPTLEHVHIRATEEGECLLSCTDLRQWYTQRVPLVASFLYEPTALTLDVKRFHSLVSGLPAGGDIFLSPTQEDCKRWQVACGAVKSVLPSFNPEDFPLKISNPNWRPSGEKFDDGPDVYASFTVDARQFARALSSVEHAVSFDKVRPILTAINLTIGPKGLYAVGTDTKRIPVYGPIPITGEVLGASVNVPHESGKELIAACQKRPEGETVAIHLREDGILLAVFGQGERSFATRLVEGDYINWGRIIPDVKILPQVLIGDVAAFDAAIKRADFITGNVDHRVSLSLGSTILLTAVSSRGTHEETLSGEYTGEEMTIDWSGTQLVQALGVVGSEQFRLRMKGELHKALMEPVGDEPWLSVLMPLSPMGGF